jgi:hypothetical protein
MIELQELLIHELEAPIMTELLEELQMEDPVDPSIVDSLDNITQEECEFNIVELSEVEIPAHTDDIADETLDDSISTLHLDDNIRLDSEF